MTKAELVKLGPYFREGERRLDGQPVQWDSAVYRTARWLVVLRELLGSPVRIIRESHGHRPDAIDACVPGVALEQVYLALTRLPGVSFGIYSGGSFHIDTRAYDSTPARWMAVHARPHDRALLTTRGLGHLVTAEKDGWLYLAYNGPDSWRGLQLVFDLANTATAVTGEAV